MRWLAFACFGLLIGAVGFVLWCWPAGASSPLVLRLTMGAWSGLAGSVLGAVLLQGVYGAGEGVSQVFWPDVLHETLYSRYGRSLGIRLILVIVALFVFTAILGSLRADSRRAPVAASAAWGVLAVALAATWAAADHAGIGSQVPLSLLSDTIHLSAGAIWLGGLTMLATIVLRRAGPAPRRARGAADQKTRLASAEAVQAVERFSPIALGCVGAILVTGTYQAWRNVGNLGGPVRHHLRPPAADKDRGHVRAHRPGLPGPHSDRRAAGPGVSGSRLRRGIRHGRPAASRRGRQIRPEIARYRRRLWRRAPLTARPTARNGSPNGVANGSPNGVANGSSNGAANGSSNGSSPDSGHTTVTLRRLRWSVAAETMIVLVVLAVTAVLVNTATARETFAPPVSAAVAFNTGGPGGRGDVSITVTPAVLGPNQIRVSVTDSAGRPYSPQQIEVALLLPARHLGPLPVALKQDGAGRYASGSVAVPIAGQWQLQITIRSDAFDETTVAVPVAIH